LDWPPKEAPRPAALLDLDLDKFPGEKETDRNRHNKRMNKNVKGPPKINFTPPALLCCHETVFSCFNYQMRSLLHVLRLEIWQFIE
jgi:hypothetical protein